MRLHDAVLNELIPGTTSPLKTFCWWVKINENSEKGKRRMEKGREEYSPHTHRGMGPRDNTVNKQICDIKRCTT
jgi:hypothetical protein